MIDNDDIERWEYQVISSKEYLILENQLNDLGQAGWDVIGICLTPDKKYLVWLKRKQ